MLHRWPDDEQNLVLPSGFDEIVRVVDLYAADRQSGIPRLRRSANRRLPALLFSRSPEEPNTPSSGDAPPVGTSDPSALVRAYRKRLVRPGPREAGHLTSLVPHALVDEARLACEPVPDDGSAAEDPHLVLLDKVARQLHATMPDGAGALRLGEFDVCLSVLRCQLPTEPADERTAVRNLLYGKHAWAFGLGAEVTRLGEDLGPKKAAALLRAAAVPVALLWRRWYGLRLDRGPRRRWVAGMLGETGRSFLGAAVALREAHLRARAVATGEARHPAAGAAAARDAAAVRQILLTALVRDLAKASRPPFWSRRRPRRPWSFVVLLPDVGAEGTPSRKFLDTFAAVAEDNPACPLLVLGAATADIPPYVVPHAQQQGVPDPAREIAALYASGAAGRPEQTVHAFALSSTPDGGSAADRLAVRPTVRVAGGRHQGWPRPLAAVTALLLAAGVGWYTLLPTAPPASGDDGKAAAPVASCQRVRTGEIVGLTDGNDGCDLAHGLYASQLRALEHTVGEQNAQVDLSKPYRTLVFFAPLSVGSQSRRTVPTGLQILRGALLAQKEVNSLNLKHQVQVRLLVANAGEYFHYGSLHGLNTKNLSRTDVSRMIADRVARDHIAAVFGLTQSRPESLQAAIELGTRGIPVLGTGVTGQPMVEDSPVSYFQLSPPDERMAQILASFASRSPRLHALTKPAPGRPAPTAIIVFDPDDTYFSADLKEKFSSDYAADGSVRLVPYRESDGGSQTPAVAANVCTLVRQTNGFVLYTGRSSVMHDLFYYLQADKNCRTRGGRVAVLAESPAPDLVLHPELMPQNYDSLTLFYSQFSLPDPGGPFTRGFRKGFGVATDSDAAAGYDALKILFGIMTEISGTDPDFRPGSVVTFLQSPGVKDYVGESGIMTLGNGDKYPRDKEVHIREITSAGATVTDLTCGAVSASADAVTRWGPSGRFPCPPESEPGLGSSS
ncbi:ABC transporter substrate-binding protein [Streptomyces sp. NBC_01261]|uniref:ABC transporter substrate-binding protein n=1 Tax=Streptomyces sp. NBC_01261 TaxID=2903802 RepID=UPI002E305975|nr:ABC transporter substrate-binding protein [Streptomyces sp. NBC_01261]